MRPYALVIAALTAQYSLIDNRKSYREMFDRPRTPLLVPEALGSWGYKGIEADQPFSFETLRRDSVEADIHFARNRTARRRRSIACCRDQRRVRVAAQMTIMASMHMGTRKPMFNSLF